MLKNRVLSSSLFVIGLITLGILTGVFTSDYYRRSGDADIPGLLWPNPKQLRPFATIDQYQQVFGLDQLKNKWSFLFFGYTHCPDICPMTMATLNETYKSLQRSEAMDNIQVIFVSVDPGRDNSDLLKNYITYFNSEFIGLGGTPEQVGSLARQIGIAWYLHDKDDRGNYLVDHSASVFLIDPEGRLLAVFSAPHDQDSIRKRFLKIREFYERQS